jgi:DNA-damage-inducible protein J
MPTKTSTVRARVEPGLKKDTEQIFEQLGINTTEAIRIFFKQVKLHRGLPFEMKIPNETTQKAISDAKSRKNLTEFDSPEQLFENLDIE